MSASSSIIDLTDRVFFITGANTGIGRVTATALARHGATVVFAGRSAEKTQPVIDAIATDTGNAKLSFVPCDLTSLASVRTAADTFVASGRPLHGLINNAGVAGVRGLTQDGYELAFGTNHLAHFLLTERLKPLLLAQPAARIVNVASTAHYQARGIDFAAVRLSTPSFGGLDEYGVSKLANVLHAAELARRLKDTSVTTYSLHPGVVATDIWERRLGKALAGIIKLFMLSSDDGARTTVHCATTPGLESLSGSYFDKQAPKKPSRLARDEALATALWDFSATAVAPFNAD